jgi:quinol monooxygenase YgiN
LYHLFRMELTIEIKARPGKSQELYQTLQALLPTMREEKGCKGCRIHRDAEDEDVFFLSAHWKARTNLEQYVRSSNGGALFGAIDLLGETARVRSGRDEPWKGIETLKRMRKGGTT